MVSKAHSHLMFNLAPSDAYQKWVMTIFLVWQQCPSMLCAMIIYFVAMHQGEINVHRRRK